MRRRKGKKKVAKVTTKRRKTTNQLKTVEDLPPEVLAYILERVPVKDLATSAILVNHLWLSLSLPIFGMKVFQEFSCFLTVLVSKNLTVDKQFEEGLEKNFKKIEKPFNVPKILEWFGKEKRELSKRLMEWGKCDWLQMEKEMCDEYGEAFGNLFPFFFFRIWCLTEDKPMKKDVSKQITACFEIGDLTKAAEYYFWYKTSKQQYLDFYNKQKVAKVLECLKMLPQDFCFEQMKLVLELWKTSQLSGIKQIKTGLQHGRFPLKWAQNQESLFTCCVMLGEKNRTVLDAYIANLSPTSQTACNKWFIKFQLERGNYSGICRGWLDTQTAVEWCNAKVKQLDIEEVEKILHDVSNRPGDYICDNTQKDQFHAIIAIIANSKKNTSKAIQHVMAISFEPRKVAVLDSLIQTLVESNQCREARGLIAQIENLDTRNQLARKWYAKIALV